MSEIFVVAQYTAKYVNIPTVSKKVAFSDIRQQGLI